MREISVFQAIFKIVGVTILVLIILFFSLKPKRLEHFPQSEVTYDQLPLAVKQIYSNFDFKQYYHSAQWYFSTNPTDSVFIETFTIFHPDADLGDFLWNGFIYKIHLNEKVYRLNANKGEPFVIHQGLFFYPTEFNLDSKRVKKTKFVRIRLPKK